MAAWAALKEAGVDFKAAAGFSLGEYTALAAAGVVSLADGVKIVSMRGKLMQQAADSIDGGMAAILGLEDSVIEEACAKVTSGVVRPVNYNCPGQLVIAGEKAALAEAIENCKAAGARRALPLAVSGAFHTPLMAKAAAEREKVDMRLYRVIYNAIEDVEAAMKGMLDPVFEEKVLGHAEVRQTFKASGVGTIAGSYVLDGLFERDCSVRLTRDGIVIFEGPLASLKRFKDDVKEVKAGYECGFVFANFNDIKEGDLVEAFKMVEVPR